MGFSEGTYHASRSFLLHAGREIAFESLELEISAPGSRELSVFCTGSIRAKIPGLSPGEKGIQVTLELDGEPYRLVDATVFDVDLEVSGKSTVQMTGRLEPLPKEGQRVETER
jgi:hypothetical protein